MLTLQGKSDLAKKGFCPDQKTISKHAMSPHELIKNTPRMSSPHRELRGQAYVSKIREGFFFKSTQWNVVETRCTPTFAFPPSLRLLILLKGYEHLNVDGLAIDLDARQKPIGLWLPISVEAQGFKRYVRGEMQDEWVLFVSPASLEQMRKNLSEVPSWFSLDEANHCQIRYFEVTQHMANLIEETRHEGQMSPLLTQLHQEAIALQILLSACQSITLGSTDQEATSIKRLAKRRLNDLLLLIESGRADDWSLEEIASYCATNVTSLQRNFQAQYHISIGQFRTKVRLERAYQALLSGFSVTQASDVAGYRHLESFTKAFKKHFGFPPSNVNPLS